jgi:hypothetical protein
MTSSVNFVKITNILSQIIFNYYENLLATYQVYKCIGIVSANQTNMTCRV